MQSIMPDLSCLWEFFRREQHNEPKKSNSLVEKLLLREMHLSSTSAVNEGTPLSDSKLIGACPH